MKLGQMGIVRQIAEEILKTFDQVAQAAQEEISNTRTTRSSDGVFARPVNTFAGETSPTKRLSQIKYSNLESYHMLSEEPAIARVVVVDEEDKQTTYYFCRAAPLGNMNERSKKFVSYRAPLGRLAELLIGDEKTIPRGGKTISVEIVEHAKFNPERQADIWDAKNTILKTEKIKTLTIESLRKVSDEPLRKAVDEPPRKTVDEPPRKTVDEPPRKTVDEPPRKALEDQGVESGGDELEALLAEEKEAVKIHTGVRRSVISKMDLRDQPILDKYQGEIFRLPLNSCLLILGAPGTGKTTTLIRRLGQKLDSEFLDDNERRLVAQNSEVEHTESWIMFTPTELLKLYVKEAFNREGIPASDDRIQTWSTFRNNLARNVFGILRTSANNSPLVMNENADTLDSSATAKEIAWFSDFDNWQKMVFWNEIRQSFQRILEDNDDNVRRIGAKLSQIMPEKDAVPPASAVADIQALATEIKGLADGMRDTTDKKIRASLNLLVNRDKAFLDEFVNKLREISDDAEDAEDLDPEDLESEEEPTQHRINRTVAVSRYFQIMRTLSRSRVSKKSIGKTSATGQLIEWLGERTLGEEDQIHVGDSLIIQSALRTFANPIRRYVGQVASRYRRFRRTRQAEGRWYAKQGFASTTLNPLEVDVILLSMLKGSDDLLKTGVANSIDGPKIAAFEQMEEIYRTQVVVDEATDFSPIQLACMFTLARPGIRSFFACGDFNQRVTNWGVKSAEHLRWAIPDIQTKEVTTAYRQSGQLHGLARQLVALAGGDPDDASLPDHAKNEGVPPVLKEQISSPTAIAGWLGARITEIETALEVLPSIAVLVNSEDEVSKIAAELKETLADKNIPVIPCLNGQVQGNDGAVRVFNVEHIKGLEFEAVFFVGIDQLATTQPDLFDKYLYVGTTRAATYLGMTCETELPSSMESLKSMFGDCWA